MRFLAKINNKDVEVIASSKVMAKIIIYYYKNILPSKIEIHKL